MQQECRSYLFLIYYLLFENLNPIHSRSHTLVVANVVVFNIASSLITHLDELESFRPTGRVRCPCGWSLLTRRVNNGCDPGLDIFAAAAAAFFFLSAFDDEGGSSCRARGENNALIAPDDPPPVPPCPPLPLALPLDPLLDGSSCSESTSACVNLDVARGRTVCHDAGCDDPELEPELGRPTIIDADAGIGEPDAGNGVEAGAEPDKAFRFSDDDDAPAAR